MKKLLLFLIVLPVIFLMSCDTQPELQVINASEAKEMLDSDSSIILVDVREQSEYDEEHIPGAVLLPVGQLVTHLEDEYPDKSATYLIYCRSGNRSNQAANIFIDLGYENVYDMGGIINWPYETE